MRVEGKESMKILHIGAINPFRPTGITNAVLNLSTALVVYGHKVAILPSIPMHIGNDMIPQGVTLITGPQRYHWNPWFISNKWLDVIKDSFGKPDIINIHGLYVPFQTAIARLFLEKGGRILFLHMAVLLNMPNIGNL